MTYRSEHGRAEDWVGRWVMFYHGGDGALVVGVVYKAAQEFGSSIGHHIHTTQGPTYTGFVVEYRDRRER